MKTDSILSPGLFKSGVKRFWPLWLVGIIGLVLLFDVPLYGAANMIVRNGESLASQQSSMQEAWNMMLLLGWAYALVGSIVVAMALNEHLFDTRAATFVGSLPTRRQGVYVTLALAGLLMLLALPVVALVLLLPARLALGAVVTLRSAASWYGYVALSVLVLFAVAQLSCHLAGTRFVALVLYLVINFLAVLVETAVQLAVGALIYGMSTYGELHEWLSPASWLFATALRRFELEEVASAQGIACAVVAALAALALAGWLFGRRDLEAAGSSVPFGPLRPVLRYLAGVSTALLFGSVYRLAYVSDAFSGLPLLRGQALAMALLMALGGALGVLIAEMVMRRSTHVLSDCWRSGLIVAIASLAFVAVCAFDLTGAGRFVPKAEDVELVTLVSDHTDHFDLASSEGVEAACDLQRDIISYGCEGEREGSIVTIDFVYKLSGGRVVKRSYPILASFFEEEGASRGEGSQFLDRFVELADAPEGRASRFANVLDGGAQGKTYQIEYWVGDGEAYSVSITVPASEVDGLAEALRGDLLEEEAGTLLAQHSWTEEGYDASLSVQRELADGMGIDLLFNMQLDRTRCPHTVAWIEEHHPEIELQPANM